MNKLMQSKYFKAGLTFFLSGACLILFYSIVKNFSGFRDGISAFIGICAPFIYGFVIAYVLAPLYNLIVRRSYPHFCKRAITKRKALGRSKFLATLVSILVLLLILIAFIWILVPRIVTSIIDISQTMNERLRAAADLFNQLADHIGNRALADQVSDFIGKRQGDILKWAQDELVPQLGIFAVKLSQGIIVTLRMMVNLFLGIIVAAYILNIKDKLKAQIRKTVYSLARPQTARSIFHFGMFTNETFGGYIVGKLIDALFVGIVCFILMMILRLPYAALISTLIGTANIIPFFGPFIGAIPAFLLIFLVNPLQAVYFLVMIFVLQQLDGNVIEPLVLGNTTGVDSFWVMFAIIMGGGLFGFMGMILGVPVFAIIYYYVGNFINRRLVRKGLDPATATYLDFNKYDINAGEVYAEKEPAKRRHRWKR